MLFSNSDTLNGILHNLFSDGTTSIGEQICPYEVKTLYMYVKKFWLVATATMADAGSHSHVKLVGTALFLIPRKHRSMLISDMPTSSPLHVVAHSRPL